MNQANPKGRVVGGQEYAGHRFVLVELDNGDQFFSVAQLSEAFGYPDLRAALDVLYEDELTVCDLTTSFGDIPACPLVTHAGLISLAFRSDSDKAVPFWEFISNAISAQVDQEMATGQYDTRFDVVWQGMRRSGEAREIIDTAENDLH